MTGKHSNLLEYAAFSLYRHWIRFRLKGAVKWPRGDHLDLGCTAIIGMCSSMPAVLAANLACLTSHRWPELREVIVVADTTRDRVSSAVETAAIEEARGLPIRFAYYEPDQARLAESLMLPYVFSWMSWSIALGMCKTRTALFHDYDALIMNDRLADRYREFASSGVKVQGIAWYRGGGVVPEDQLATTFETFVDVAWLRSFPSIRMFNDLKLIKGRAIDYDTLLELQHHELAAEDRAIAPMSVSDMVHPTQMIHQFTMFRRNPGGNLPCASIPMIPFYEYLHSGDEPIRKATEQIKGRGSKTFSFLESGLIVNFNKLTTPQVDWCLKLMTQACVLRDIPPSRTIFEYGLALYELVETPDDRIWVGDFTDSQRHWIEAASSLQHTD